MKRFHRHGDLTKSAGDYGERVAEQDARGRGRSHFEYGLRFLCM